MENKQNTKRTWSPCGKIKVTKKKKKKYPSLYRRDGPRNFPRQKLNSSPLAESKNVCQHEALAGHCQQWDSLVTAVGVHRKRFSEFPDILRTTGSWTCDWGWLINDFGRHLFTTHKRSLTQTQDWRKMLHVPHCAQSAFPGFGIFPPCWV